MSEASLPTDITELDFEARVLQRSHEVPVIVDFWASWCQPCLMLAPLLDHVLASYPDQVELVKVDVDRNPNLAQLFGATAIPLVVGFRDGQVVASFNGVQPEPILREFIERLIPSDVARLLKKAYEQEVIDLKVATQLYQEVLELDSKNSLARAALAEIHLNDGQLESAQQMVAEVEEGTDGYDRASKVKARLEFQELAQAAGDLALQRERVAAEPDNLNQRLQLGLSLAARGDYEEALQILLQIVETDRDFGSVKVRPRMVQIFQIIGPNTPLAQEYRSQLSSALF